MLLVAMLLERAKGKAAIESDYRLAKILSINQSALSNYRSGRSMPNEKIIAQLCALSGDDPDVIAAQIQAARAQSDEGRALWLRIAKRLQGAATPVLLSWLIAIGLIAAPAHEARANENFSSQSALDFVNDNLYIVEYRFYLVCDFLLVRLRQISAILRLSFYIY